MFRAVLLFLLLLPGLALAESRVAFVVGNSAYLHSNPLKNPVADARLIADTLAGLDFDVTLHLDQSRADLGRNLSSFVKTHKGADVMLFYFAGHGMQFDGKNYLIPVDAALASEFDILGETISLEQVLTLMQRNSKASLVFIDACRDNPLANAFYTQNFSETRAMMTRGLAPVTSMSDGAMVVFSASPGQVAFDGEGANSIFAESLARHLDTENAEVLSLMKRVIRDVKGGTGDKQTPMVTNDLVTEIYLNLGDSGPGAVLAYNQEEAFFEAASAIGTRRAWNIYLDKFPAGRLREFALSELERLETAELSSVSGTLVEADNTLEVSASVARGTENKLGLSKENYQAIQQALLDRGYDPGAPDGVVGVKTRQAIADFQASMNLTVTGVITSATALALDVELDEAETGDQVLVASSNVRKFDPDMLAVVEADRRLIRAARELKDFEIAYGIYDGRIYIAVLSWGLNFEQSQSLAERAGGHLATMTSEEENDFVFDLVKGDKRLWEFATDDQGTFGPMFGLRQLPNSLEPEGGWAWVTGEPVDYLPWDPNEPNNYANTEHVAKFHHYFAKPVAGQSNAFASPLWGDLPDGHVSFVMEIE